MPESETYSKRQASTRDSIVALCRDHRGKLGGVCANVSLVRLCGRPRDSGRTKKERLVTSHIACDRSRDCMQSSVPFAGGRTAGVRFDGSRPAVRQFGERHRSPVSFADADVDLQRRTTSIGSECGRSAGICSSVVPVSYCRAADSSAADSTTI